MFNYQQALTSDWHGQIDVDFKVVCLKEIIREVGNRFRRRFVI